MDSTPQNSGRPNTSSATAAGSFSFIGGPIASRPEPSQVRAETVTVKGRRLIVTLRDGREVAVPLDWFPRLRDASVRERHNYELIGEGELIHWPDVDEDIDVPNLLRV
jgi:hypothetical protein